jgi:hypothetical protein
MNRTQSLPFTSPDEAWKHFVGVITGSEISIDEELFSLQGPQGSVSAAALLGGIESGVPTIFSSHLIRVQGGAPAVTLPRERSTENRVLPRERNATVELFDHLLTLKVDTSQIAMHLEGAWRAGLFRQLDDLLDEDNWDIADVLPTRAAFLTFLRMIILLGRPRRPSLGVTDDGNIVASWTRQLNRLTIECQPKDDLRWVLVRYQDAEPETGAGTCKVEKLGSRLAPYDPGIWFDADNIRSGFGPSAAPREGTASPQG